MEGNVSCQRIGAELGLHHVSVWTVNRAFKRMGYGFMEARKKGILTEKDYKERLQICPYSYKNVLARFFRK